MQNTWYKLDLGDGITAHEPLVRIREAFANIVQGLSDSDEIAVFIRHESDRSLHCHIIAFFSPAAFELASLMNAVTCPKPERNGLELVVGSSTCWQLLFPETDT